MSKPGKSEALHDPLAWIAQGRKEGAPKAPKAPAKALSKVPARKAKGKGKPTPGR